MSKRRKKNIMLVGYMGCGKSTVGRKAARAFQMEFLDTDEVISQEEGCPVSELFATKGEEYFRKKETELIQRLLKEPKGMLIATGGGLPMREENRSLLKELGHVVYLKCTVETLVKRLSGDITRPLLADGNLEEKITSMLEIRNPVYESVADLIIETEGKSFYETICILERIIKKKKEKNNETVNH